ncbi:MAG: AAA family ATPase, partial [Gaiellaceae bacterium]
LRVLGRRKLVFLLIVVLVPATAVAVSLIQSPTYRASAEVLLEPRDLGATYIDPQRVAQTRAELARVPAVVDRVLDTVPSAGLDRKEFLESSTVSATLGTDILTFSVENSDPRLAMRLATEYANAFTEYQQRLDNQAVENMLDQVRQQLAQLEANGEGAGSANYDALQRREEALAAAATAQSRSARVVNPAGEAPKVGPRTVRNGLIAFCLGLVLALVIVFLVDALDTRVRSVDSIREALGLPLLGRLAPPPSRLEKTNGLVMLADPASREAAQFRALRASLDLANAEHGSRTIMITSAIDAEGKSTTVANLAVALARAGRRVIVIDADLSRPHVHRLFSVDERPGLTDLELGGTRLEEALRPIAFTEEAASEADDLSRRMDRTGSLEVLPGGSALQDPDELGFENVVGRVIQRARDRADIVLVDAPPLLMGHAIALSAQVDAVVVVVRLKASRMLELQDMSRILEASPVTKLGFILTGADKREGYGQHQRYAASRWRAEARPRPMLTVSPSAADGDGEVPGRRRSETHASERPNETTSETETEERGDKPAPSPPVGARSKSVGQAFETLSPSKPGKRSAQSRKPKSAQRADAAERAALDAANDALKDD